MKRFLLSIALVLIFATSSFATNYYGCGAGAINGDTTWCAVGDVTAGVCAKDSGDYVLGATALAGTHTLYANGCTITIPSGTFTATKISTKGDGSKGAGGGFTANADDITVTLDASIEGGTTDCLTITNSTGTATVVNILTTSGGGTITTSTTAGADGIYISGSKVTVNIGKSDSPVTMTGGGAANSAVNDISTVTTKTVYATISGGSGSSALGYSHNAATGILNITGNVTGGTAGSTMGVVKSSGGTLTVNGNCTGGANNTSAPGCNNNSGSGSYTVTGDCTAVAAPGCHGPDVKLTVNGNIISSTVVTGATGGIVWAPSSAQKYVKFNGGGTIIYASAGLGSDAGGTQITGANTAAQVATGTYFVKKDDSVYTQGTKAAGGGGGAWSF